MERGDAERTPGQRGRIRARLQRPVTVLLAAAVPFTGAQPASAVPGPVLDIPPVLAAELSPAEETTLASLTTGSGVKVEAFVETPDGPEIIVLDAGDRAAGQDAADLLDAQPSVDGAGLSRPVEAAAGSVHQYGNELLRSDRARAAVDGDLSSVVVAVLDTGVADHPELVGALLPGRNFTSDDPADWGDRDGHGTHVAGTVAADPGGEIEGVAAGVKVLPVKVLGDTGSGSTDWVAAGILWAADNGADVINMSLGSSWPAEAITSAIGYARSRGVTVVAAAGNRNWSIPFYPAADPGVVGVSAVDEYVEKAYFSNFGSYVDLAAPGVAIRSAGITTDHNISSGTSMASPHVAGVAALVEAAAPALTPDQVEQAMTTSAADLGEAGRDDVFGHGLVDALRAVQAADRLEAGGPPPTNAAPTADDEVLDLPYNPGRRVLDVLDGDTDPDGDLLEVASFTQPPGGTVERAGAALTYTPSTYGPLTDSFTYTVSDGRGGQATATVSLALGEPDPDNRPPVVTDETFHFQYDQPAGLLPGLLSNDTDPDGDRLTVVGVSAARTGAVELVPRDPQTVRYTPPQDTWGRDADSFTYTVFDGRGGFATGTAHFDIERYNTQPVAMDDTVTVPHDASSVELPVLANDSDADGDGLWIGSTTPAQRGTVERHGDHLRYTVEGDHPEGTTDSVTYTVFDGHSGTATATVTIVVERPPTPFEALHRALGGSAGVLGAPTSDVGPIPGGTAQAFERGQILQKDGAAGPVGVIGAVHVRYQATGGPTGPLGFPTGAEVAQAGGGKRQDFAGGSIFWRSSTGAQVVTGPIGTEFTRLGGVAVLGYPKAAQAPAAVGTGRYQVFEKGRVYWAGSTGARAVRGTVLDRYLGSGAEKVVGYPTTHQSAAKNGGVAQHFQKGSIFSSSRTGAHLVSGAIRAKWKALDYEKGRLGYPTSAQSSVPGAKVQKFQGGTISVSTRTGKVTVTYR